MFLICSYCNLQRFHEAEQTPDGWLLFPEEGKAICPECDRDLRAENAYQDERAEAAYAEYVENRS